MANVSETVPGALQSEVDAALAWFNDRETASFEVTGIVDAELAAAAASPRKLQLVLCGGGACLKKNFLVSPSGSGFDIALADEPDPILDTFGAVQAELDPPPGALRNWLDDVVSRHDFVLLLFYRGFW